MGCDWLTLTFPLAAADLMPDADGVQHWRSRHDDSDPSFDQDAPDVAGEQEDDEDDQDEDDDSGAEDDVPAGRQDDDAPLTVLHRDLRIDGARVHLRVWQRGDQWGTPGARYVGADRDDRWWAKVSFNPSRLRDPRGWRLCPADEAFTWALALLLALGRSGLLVPQCRHINGLTGECEHVEVARSSGHSLLVEQREPTGRPWCEDVDCLADVVTVSRIDAAVDFCAVRSTELWVDAFMGHRQARAGGSKHRHSRWSASAAAGQKGLRVSLYDKAVESSRRGRPVSARAPAGTLRVEVRARRPKLEKVMRRWHDPRPQPGQEPPPLRRLALVTPELLTALFLEGFDWAGLDRWIGGEHPLRPVRRSLDPLTARRLRKFLDDHAAGRQPVKVVLQS